MMMMMMIIKQTIIVHQITSQEQRHLNNHYPSQLWNQLSEETQVIYNNDRILAFMRN